MNSTLVLVQRSRTLLTARRRRNRSRAPGADKGLRGDGEEPGIPRARCRAREGRLGARRGAGLCGQDGGVARGGGVVGWAREGGRVVRDEADGGGVGVGVEEEEQGRARVGGQQPVGAVREAVRGLRRFGFLRRSRDVVGQRPWIPCDMGLSLPKTCPMCGMSKSPPLKIWGYVMRMPLSLGGLGERDGCEQSTEESKLAINSWRNGKEGVQVILIRGLAVLGNS